MMALLPVLPAAIKGFEDVNRYWDSYAQAWVAKILPGQLYVSCSDDEVISTTLGSCVAACIRDRIKGIGGVNHFMLPWTENAPSETWKGMATRYGIFAMESLINEILKAGGERCNLEMKVCGGARIINGISNDIGRKNSDFILSFAQTEGIPLIAYDLGDIHPRKLMYYPSTGQMYVKRIQQLHNDTVYQRESQYHEQLKAAPQSGGVELFDR
mgnify:CR=1 FL=1